ncbi:MAG: UpxY family transcription antiterminator, partial [Cyclobacteriaceae bacterium]|nr:UpxY family transcription antiterminator [Cyclobacteriaceae bacterium]
NFHPPTSIMKNWYAVYTKPRSEKKVTERLSDSGFEMYCPLMKTMRQWSDRKKKVQLPMFPGYVFVYVEENERSLILQDSGVLNFVFWLGKPAVIRDNEIEAIKKIAENGEEINISAEAFEIGRLVIIPEGPFKGMTGKVDKLDKRKIIVLVDQLGCMVSFRYKVE